MEWNEMIKYKLNCALFNIFTHGSKLMRVKRDFLKKKTKATPIHGSTPPKKRKHDIYVVLEYTKITPKNMH